MKRAQRFSEFVFGCMVVGMRARNAHFQFFIVIITVSHIALNCTVHASPQFVQNSVNFLLSSTTVEWGNIKRVAPYVAQIIEIQLIGNHLDCVGGYLKKNCFSIKFNLIFSIAFVPFC